MMKRRLPTAFYNGTSYFGLTLSGLALAMIAFLFVLDRFSPKGNPYMGLITFVALPTVLIIGILIAFFGLWRAARREKKGLPVSRSLKIDLANPKHRSAVGMILSGAFFFFALSAFGTYKAYEYTESVEFCGKVCHGIMKPEYVAYQASPHARVPCAGCHIGSGATWYVRSKLSGAYQVYSSLFNKYSRPIETPIRQLRPAKETCEECHWPSHFYSQKLKDRTYFLSDESNTRFQISMLMKIGGSEQGRTAGIHAHMYLNNQVTYVATDQHRQVIPYVESRDADGKVTVYRSTEVKITDEELNKAEHRIVDCIDCHNRPSHVYHHPEVSVNIAMANGWISPKLPEIKAKSVEILEKPYKTEAEALDAIATGLRTTYKTSYPNVATTLSKELEQAIRQVQTIYKQNYFPEMKVSWKVYPNNLDHLHSAGCFRCHDDKHVSSDGKVISKNCQTCHTILSQQSPDGKRESSLAGLEFKHPVDIGDSWKTEPCQSCHAGGSE